MKMRYKVNFFLLDGLIPLEQSYETLSGTGPENAQPEQPLSIQFGASASTVRLSANGF